MILRVLSIIFVIQSISGVSESLLQKEMKFKIISIVSISGSLLYGILAISLAFLNYGVWALVVAQLLRAIYQTIFYLVKQPINMSLKINKNSAKELIYFGVGLTLFRVFNNIANQGDYFVVSRTLGSLNLGFYNRAYQLLMIPTNVIGSVLDKVLFPLLSRYQDEFEKLRYVFSNIINLISLMAFPITIISITVGSDIVAIVLGPNWNKTIVPFNILIISLNYSPNLF